MPPNVTIPNRRATRSSGCRSREADDHRDPPPRIRVDVGCAIPARRGHSMTLNGIDVSKWQLATPPLAGMEFLFARASIGTTPDERFDMHIANAEAAGLVTGAYHFNWKEIPVTEQVTAFLKAAGDVHLLVVDVEGQHAFSLTQTKLFIAGVKAADPKKRKVGLYMSDSGFYMTA